MEKLKTYRKIKVKRAVPGAVYMIVLQLLTAFISFSLSRISFGEAFPPFASGFIAGVPLIYILSASVFGSIGFYINFPVLEALKNVTVCCLTAFIRLGFEQKTSENKRMIYGAILGFSVYFLPSLAVFLAAGQDIAYIIKCTGEAVISAAFACFTQRVSKIITTGRQGAFFSPADIAAFMFTGSVVILGISSFGVSGFSPGRSLAYFSVLLFSLSDIRLLSAVAGACLALTLGTVPENQGLAFTFTAGGIACSLCAAWGKAASAFILTGITLLSVILSGNTSGAAGALAETITAGLLFLIIPSASMMKLLHAFTLSGINKYEEEKTRFLELRLKTCAEAVKDVAESSAAVSRLLLKSEKPKTGSIPAEVKEDVCSSCTKKDFCWNGAENITREAFIRAADIMTENGILRVSDLPARLSLLCRKSESLTEAFNRCYCEMNAMREAKREITDAHIAAAGVFSVTGELLEDTAQELKNIPHSDPDLAEAFRTALYEADTVPLSLSAVRHKNGRCTAEAFCRKIPAGMDWEPVLQRLFDITGEAFSAPLSHEYQGDCCVLCFTTGSRYTVKYAVSSHQGAGESFCGDTSKCFSDGRGYFYAVLSDGMGTGGRAAVDSVMTCTLMSRLLTAGFSPEAALTAVNCALMIKSSEETLSTLDILRINTDSGEAVFYKAGAGISYIDKGGRTMTVEKSSAPLGILPEAKLEKSVTSLMPGDMAVIMSDGAGVVPPECFRDMFRAKERADVKKFASDTVKKAMEMSVSGRNDDITVIALKIEKNEIYK